MIERYLIYKPDYGYFTGIDYDKNWAIFNSDVFKNENAVLFKTEFEASKRLYELTTECNDMRGVYKIEKVIFIQ